MGGRGGSSGSAKGGSADGTIISKAVRKIETTYRQTPTGFARGHYKDEILEAVTDGKGNLTFSYAKADSFDKPHKTNKTSYATFNLKAGAVNGETFNINWNKVNSVSGQTFSIKQEAKKAGLSWDGKEKKWKRKK